jgi:ribonuclease G
MLCEPCFYCRGEGKVKSRRSVCYEIFRKISREATGIGGSNVTIKVHPRVADIMLTEETDHIELLEKGSGKRFTIIPVEDMHIKRYEIIWNE